MRILLCAATEMEISPTIHSLSLRDGHAVNFLITGIGMLASAFALTKEVVTNRPELIIQAGLAGSLHKDVSLAGVVQVKTECIGDMGVQEKDFRSVFDLRLLSAVSPPWKNGKLVNESSFPATVDLPVVNGVTVNEITTNEGRIKYYRNSLGADVESMEGAALHYIAILEKIPFLQIRSLSNFIGERDKQQWKMKESITSLNQALQMILTKLEVI